MSNAIVIGLLGGFSFGVGFALMTTVFRVFKSKPIYYQTRRDYFAANALQAHFIIDAITCNAPGRESMSMMSHTDTVKEAFRTADIVLSDFPQTPEAK